jgi:hypothetical protein
MTTDPTVPIPIDQTPETPVVPVDAIGNPDPSESLPLPSRAGVRFELPDASGVPDWVIVPPGMKLPRSKQVVFLRFRPGMTDTPAKGERQAIVWSNNLGDQRLAIMRADKDPNVMPEQLAKQMIRVVDGKPVDWTGEAGAANIDAWWEEIGPKCRSVIDRLFVQLHVASQDELKDFFENCVAVRGVGG